MKKENNYDFPVKMVPIISKEYKIEIPNRFAVMRTDTKKPVVVGVVSRKYQIIKHKEVVDGFRKALKETLYKEKIKVAENGAKMFVTLDLTEVKGEARKGDIVSLQLTIKNSYDGKSALQLILGALRLKCKNGMVVAEQFLSYSQRHIGSGENNINTDKIHDKITLLTSQFKNTLPLLQEMSRKKMTDDPSLLEELFNPKKPKRKTDNPDGPPEHIFPQYLVEIARDTYGQGKDKTVWGYYNAFTVAITHHLQSENPQVSIDYGKIAWNMAKKALVDDYYKSKK